MFFLKAILWRRLSASVKNFRSGESSLLDEGETMRHPSALAADNRNRRHAYGAPLPEKASGRKTNQQATMIFPAIISYYIGSNFFRIYFFPSSERCLSG